MPASTMQKPKANQVICEKCGEWCDFECEICPFCGTSLYGDEPQKNGDEPQNDRKSNEKDNEKDEVGEQNPQKNDEDSKPEPPKEDAKTNEQKEPEHSESRISNALKFLKEAKEWFSESLISNALRLLKGVKDWIKEYYLVLLIVLGIPLILVVYVLSLYLLDYIGFFKL